MKVWNQFQVGWNWFHSWVGKILQSRDRLPAPVFLGFPGGSDGKESAWSVGDLGLIPELDRSPWGGHGKLLQYSWILWRIPKNRGAWATEHTRWNRYCSGSPALMTLMLFAYVPSLSHIHLQCLFILCRHPAPPLWLRVMIWAHGILMYVSFPGGSGGKESVCNVGNLGSVPGLGRSPGGGPGNPLQYSCLENPHGQRNLAGYSPWGHKELDTTEQLSIHAQTEGFPDGSVVKNLPTMQESQGTQVWSLGHEDPVEEGMATHSSILAGRIPIDRGAWQSTVHGSQRVGHDWNDLARTHTHNANRDLNSACVSA